MNRHVFVSYASADRARVEPIVAALEEAGLSVWFDRSGIPGGVSYGPEIARAIKESGALLLMCSANAFASRNVRQEIQLAWRYERPILPLLLEPVAYPEDLAYWLEGHQWVDLHDQFVEAWLPDLLRALDQLGLAVEPRDVAAGPPATRASISLPTPLTDVIGRESELHQIASLLASHRLVTLTGPGGVGKTRLAIEAARFVASGFLAGVEFIDLAAILDPRLVLSAIAQPLGVLESPDQALLSSLQSAIDDGQLLLLLDNFEHVLDAAPDIASLLAACPRLAVLATSRSPLELRGEQPVLIEPLSVSPDGVKSAHVNILDAPAISLFISRATSADPNFNPTSADLPVVAEICARLDGLPLAIELAAARVKLLSLEELLAKLDQRLPLLTSGARDLPERQRTLRDAIAWSYDLLSPSEQALFRRLAVFLGGWTFAAAESVGNEHGDLDLLDGLSALVDRSLVRRVTGAGSEQRFGMLETIREFGLDQLRANREEADVRTAHLMHFLTIAQRSKTEHSGQQQQLWFSQLDAELGNLRGAMEWALSIEAANPALMLTGELHLYWFWRSMFAEGLDWSERALARADGATPEATLRAMYCAGSFAHHTGNYVRLREIGAAMLALATIVGDNANVAGACSLLSLHAGATGDQGAAVALAEKAVEAARRSGDSVKLGDALVRAGVVFHVQGDLERAESIHREALSLLVDQGRDASIAVEQANLADIANDRGQLIEAAALYRQSGETFLRLDIPWMSVEILLGAAHLLVKTGETDLAARLLGAAESLRRRIGLTLYARPGQRLTETMASVQEALDEGPFQSLWADGELLSMHDAMREADDALRQILELASSNGV